MNIEKEIPEEIYTYAYDDYDENYEEDIPEDDGRLEFANAVFQEAYFDN